MLLSENIFEDICSWEFCKIHWKTTMLESLFKVAGIKTAYDKCFPMTCFFKSPLKIKQHFRVNKLAKYHNRDSHISVHWYFGKHFSELSYHFFSKSKGRILDGLGIPFNHIKKWKVYIGTIKRHFLSEELQGKF